MKRLDPEIRPLVWRQLAGLLASGLSLSDALLALGRDSDSRRVRELTDGLGRHVADGEPLSTAVARSGAFDDTTVASLKAAEASGRLVEMCRILADHEERSRGLRLRARMVLAYPVMLWLVGVAVSSALVAFTADTFATLEVLQTGLGSPDSGYLSLFWLAVSLNVALLFAAVGGLASTYVWRTRPGGDTRRRLERLVLRIPLWSRYWRAVVAGRFLRGLGTLLRADVPLDRALELAGGTAGSLLLDDDARLAANAVRDGSGAGAALGRGPLLSPAVLWTLRTAETRGDLVESVEELAVLYDETAEIGGATALTVLEPTAIVVAGSLAAVLVLAVALPTMNLYAMVP